MMQLKNNTDNKNQTPTVAFYTLGCKLNQSETDSMAEDLQARGFEILDMRELLSENKTADFLVINTCTVTAKADRKTRHSIYRALQLGNIEFSYISPNKSQKLKHFIPEKPMQENKKSVVLVTGCFVGNDNDELKQLPINYVVDNSKKKHIPQIIDSHHKGHILDVQNLEQDFFGFTASQGIFRTRSNLKIQDGCDNFCTFCIIPNVRGKAQSKPLEQIMQDARTLIECGTKEIILTGVNMSRFDDGKNTFSDVLESLTKLPGNFRIRISSLEPDTLDDKFYEILQHPKICPHLHLCLQSGSEKILLQMRRMYTKKEFLLCVNKIKKQNPLFNFTTDVIVGFPGETDADFNESLQTIKEVGFSHIHAFPYSAREGTRASRLKDVDFHIKKERIHILTTLSNEQKNIYRKKMLGITQQFLIEKISEYDNTFYAEGLSEYYVPIRAKINTNTTNNNTFLNKLTNILAQKTVYNNKNEVLLSAILEDKFELVS